jgi:hypothetical protein
MRIFVVIFCLLSMSLTALAETSNCPQVTTLDNALSLFLGSEASGDQVCLLVQRNQIVDIAFKSEEKAYLELFKKIQPIYEERSNLKNDEDQDAIFDLVKSLQDKWFDKYMLQAIDDHKPAVVFGTLGASATATLLIVYVWKMKELKVGAIKGWGLILKNILTDKALIARLISSLGTIGSATAAKFPNKDKNEQILPAPFTLLDIADTVHWTYSDFKMVRDVITYAASTVAGVYGTNPAINVIGKAYSTVEAALEKNAPKSTRWLHKIMNGYNKKVKPKVNAVAKTAKTTPASFVVGYFLSDIVLSKTEWAINQGALWNAGRELEKMENAIAQAKNPLQLLAAVENHVVSLKWLVAAKSKRAMEELTDAEETYNYNMACDSFLGRLTTPILNREERQGFYYSDLLDNVHSALEKWESYRASNVELIKKEIDLIQSLDKPYLRHFIDQLKPMRDLYSLAGSEDFQAQMIHHRFVNRVGADFFQKAEVDEDIRTKMGCPNVEMTQLHEIMAP